MRLSAKGLPIPPEWEREPERECPQTPHCPNSCGRPSGECGGCAYEELRIDAFPCSRCWNGDGNGDWCYCEVYRRTNPVEQQEVE